MVVRHGPRRPGESRHQDAPDDFLALPFTMPKQKTPTRRFGRDLAGALTPKFPALSKFVVAKPIPVIRSRAAWLGETPRSSDRSFHPSLGYCSRQKALRNCMSVMVDYVRQMAFFCPLSKIRDCQDSLAFISPFECFQPELL